MKIHIALCDDNEKALPIISGAVESAFKEQGIKTELDIFSRGEELLEAMEGKEYPLVLLDIDMPGMDGIQVGQQIRSKNYSTQIVYVSECEERVFESFMVQPLGFVRKSNFLNDIAAVVQLYMKKYGETVNRQTVELATRNGVVMLYYQKIRYIESCRNYQLVNLFGEKEQVEIKMTMEKLEALLEPLGFIRIHKGYLVNYRYIQRINSEQIMLQDGTQLPIGRSKVAEVKSRYLSFL